MNLSDIKIYLPAVRVNTGMTQREWADAIGVSFYTVNNWESGKTSPNINQVRKMSELSGIPIDCIYPCHDDTRKSD